LAIVDQPAQVNPGQPPGPKNRHPFSQLPLLNANRADYFLSLTRTYGDVVFFTIAGQRLWLINDPELLYGILVTDAKNFKKTHGYKHMGLLIGNGLLASDGEEHKRQRRLMQPTFMKQRIAVYGDAMAEYAEKHSAKWHDGQEVDFCAEMMRVALLIVAKTLFDTDAEKDAAIFNDALEAFFATLHRVENPLRPILNVLPVPANFRLWKARKRLDDLMYGIIERRRASGDDRGDVLSSLLAAQDEEGDGKGMTNAQMRDEIVTLFMAGHETTALTLTWAAYLVATHPEVQAKLQEEADRVLQGRRPSAADMPNLPYTRQVVSETLRLYPAAYAMDRTVINDYPLGEWTAKAGDTIVMCQYATQRHPKYWPNPDNFDPDRWAPDAPQDRPRFAFFPFGGGPRICIGEGFAWMETMLLLATFMRDWRLELKPGTVVESEPFVTLRPKGGMPMILRRR
jgi:cytochrome P450